MDNPERAWSVIVRRQNCSLTGSLRFPLRVFMGISRKSDLAFGKCYQALQDGVRYTVTNFLLPLLLTPLCDLHVGQRNSTCGGGRLTTCPFDATRSRSKRLARTAQVKLIAQLG
jgi:hypothetical protein